MKKLALVLSLSVITAFASDTKTERKILLQSPCYIEVNENKGGVGKFFDKIFGDGDGVWTSFCGSSVVSRSFYDIDLGDTISYNTTAAHFSYLNCTKTAVTKTDKDTGKVIESNIQYRAQRIEKNYYFETMGSMGITKNIGYLTQCETRAKEIYSQIKTLSEADTEAFKEFVQKSLSNVVEDN